MTQTQRIKYTLTGYNFTQVSGRKGNIEYQLMDDQGNERTVNAMANLNLFKKVSSVKPIYHRELPLVQALAKIELNDSVLVDFSEFNKNNPRGSMRSKKGAIPTVKVKGGSSAIYDLGSVFDNKARLAQLAFVSILGFIAVTYVINKIPSPYS